MLRIYLLLLLSTPLSLSHRPMKTISSNVQLDNAPKAANRTIPAPARIFIRRMRKAGSSTVFGFFLEIVNMLKSRHRNVIYDRMEYQALNDACVFGLNAMLAPKRTLLITHFRKPVDRINSEYWYQGPGKTHRVSNSSLWWDWINSTNPAVGTKFNAGIYFSNYYTRMLSANCTSTCEGMSGFNSVKGCSANSRLQPFRQMYLDDLNRAIRVLSKFQIIIILEYLSKPETLPWLRETLQIEVGLAPQDLGDLRFGWGRANNKVSCDMCALFVSATRFFLIGASFVFRACTSNLGSAGFRRGIQVQIC